jgi:hypothetical protein
MEREKQFKNRSQNAEELKARRVEVQVGLRKEKREEHLAKRRHFTEASDRASAHDGIIDEVIGMVWFEKSSATFLCAPLPNNLR